MRHVKQGLGVGVQRRNRCKPSGVPLDGGDATLTVALAPSAGQLSTALTSWSLRPEPVLFLLVALELTEAHRQAVDDLPQVHFGR